MMGQLLQAVRSRKVPRNARSINTNSAEPKRDSFIFQKLALKKLLINQ